MLKGLLDVYGGLQTVLPCVKVSLHHPTLRWSGGEGGELRCQSVQPLLSLFGLNFGVCCCHENFGVGWHGHSLHLSRVSSMTCSLNLHCRSWRCGTVTESAGGDCLLAIVGVRSPDCRAHGSAELLSRRPSVDQREFSKDVGEIAVLCLGENPV